MRFALAAVLTTLALPAAAFDPGNMTEAERQAFRDEVRSYLMENPQVIIDAVDALEQEKAAAAVLADMDLVKTYSKALFEDANAWVGGNPDGDVTLVEFVDLRCGYCRKASAEVEELVQSDGNIRLIFKDYPILGPESELSARFAIAVRQLAGDAPYKAAHDALITLRGDVTPDALGRLAASLNLDPNLVSDRMNAPEVTAVIQANHDLGRQMAVNGTPTFVIGGQMVRGYVPLDGMRQLVEQERSDG